MERQGIKIFTAVVCVVTVLAAIAAVTVCMVFPNKYASEVNSAADEFGLDRSLVRAVVWAESKFDRYAVSDKGASGLMQLMPDTLDFCANALYIKNAKNNRFDPNVSLRCGCYYLSLLIDKFDGNVTAALMAYNSGEANAKKFLAGQAVFPETARYVKNIGLAQKVYGILG